MAAVVKRVATGLVKWSIGLAVALLVVLAVLVGLARQVVYEIDSLQADVAQYLSNRTGVVIDFAHVSGSWKGLAPRFRIEQLSVRRSPEHEPAITARHADLEVLLLQSALLLQPRVRLTVDGLVLTLAKRDGRMVVEGLDAPPASDRPATDFNALADLIAAQPRLAINDSLMTLKGLYAQDVALSVQNLQIESGKVRRYAKGRVTLKGPSNLSFDLKAQMRGSLLRAGSLTGDLYLDAGFADWLPWIPPEHRQFKTATLESLQGGSESWLKLKNGRVVDATSRFTLHDFNLASGNEVQPPRIKTLSGVGRWQEASPGNWTLALHDLRMVTPSFVWQPSELRVSATALGADDNRFAIALDDADITPWLNYFLALQPEEGTLYRTLKELRPAGKLHQLALAVEQKAGAITDYRFSADIRQFNSRPWEKYPGFRDLDINLKGRQGKLLVKLADDYLELNYPWLFRDVLSLTRLDGSLLLNRTDAGFELQSSLLRVHSSDLRSATQFSLLLPADTTQPPFLALQSTLRDVDAEKKSLYLPFGVIPPKLLQWLDEGILSGRLARGDIVVHGALGKDHASDRRLLLGFTVHDAALRFLPDWTEPVKNLDADVIVDRGAVYGEAVQGEYFQQVLQSARVTVPPVPQGAQHLLQVQALTAGRADTGFDVLQTTPLAKLAGPIIQDMEVQGDMTVDLDLAVPLDKGPRKTEVDVDVALRNGTFDLTSQKLQAVDLNTDVHFDLEHGLSAPALRGQSFAGPLTGKLETRKVRQGGQTIVLGLQGKAQVSALQDWLHLSLLQPLSGALDYQVDLQVPTGEAKKHLHGYLNVTSQLKGTRIDLPAPYGKSAKARREFRVWQSMDREPSLFSVRYDDLFELSLQRRQGQVSKGVLTLGGQKAVLPSDDVFRVEGNLGRFDPAEWETALAGIRKASGQYQENVDSTRLALLDSSRLTINELILGENNLGALSIDLQRQGGDWRLGLSSNAIAGTVQLPPHVFKGAGAFTAADRPVQVQLDHVRLPKKELPEGAPEPEWVPSSISPLDLPNARVLIKDLQVGDGSFGRWALSLQRTPQGLQLNDIDVFMRSVQLKAKGDWTDIGGVRTTKVLGSFTSSNIADVMRDWGTEPSMSSHKMTGNLNLNWPGAPFEFSLRRAGGAFDVDLQKGAFLNVKSGVVGKFWGALNFETLLRRLQLDFKDLSEKDMVYDRIQASANLDRGLMHVKDVSLDSPAIKLQTSGDINLHTDQLDMVMRVTVPVTRNLVIPAAAIGGVPAGAAAFVIERMLGDQFDKLTTLKYSVKGGFDDPKVEIVNSFNLIPSQVRDAVMGSDKAPAPGTPSPAVPLSPAVPPADNSGATRP